MKIQPIDSSFSAARPPAAKSRLKRLFERQFPGVLKIAPAEMLAAAGGGDGDGDGGEMDPSSLCLAKMVQNFMEPNEKPPPSSRCDRGRDRRRNCFNGNCSDSSDDEHEFATGDAAEAALKCLIPCVSVWERNLLADATKIVRKNDGDGGSKSFFAGELQALGYNVSTCKSRWEKTPSIPSGEHEYVDVIVNGERLLVETDFRSEFEIARPTKAYRAALQSLPPVFVGSADRLRRIVAVVSEAARLSLKKKGLHFPPWRKPEYMSSKWLAPYERSSSCAAAAPPPSDEPEPASGVDSKSSDEMEVKMKPSSAKSAAAAVAAAVEKIAVVAPPWQPPALKPKLPPANQKVVAGLASVLGATS